MKNNEIIEKLYKILQNKNNISKNNLKYYFNLLIKINENLLKNFEVNFTPNLSPENSLELLTNMKFGMNFDDEKNDKLNEEDLIKILKNIIINIKSSSLEFFDYLKENNNNEMETIFNKIIKTVGLLKIYIIEFFRRFIDVITNAYANDLFKIRN